MSTTDPASDEWLTPQQAAAMVGITADTLRKWANHGVLPAQRIRPGGHRRFKRSDVQALVQSAPSEPRHTPSGSAA